jgi:hypothetical protein
MAVGDAIERRPASQTDFPPPVQPPDMSLASETRDAVRARPFLHDALAAGVVNYAAAARELDVDGDDEAITAALRRFAEELPEPDRGTDDGPTVRMKSGLEPVDGGGVDGGGADGGGLLRVGDGGYAAGAGSLTGVLATGDLGARALERALGRLRGHGIDVEAAGVAGGALLVVVGRRDGPGAVRLVETV